MTVEITLNLPESLVESAQCLENATQRDVAGVLVDALLLLLPTLENLPNDRLYTPVSKLSDASMSQ
ncbi:MAG: hypothetical protein QNJ64_19010 [Crocosphaera sp.]|nr:hypothetical protein [Crocosphaera sp.]